MFSIITHIKLSVLRGGNTIHPNAQIRIEIDDEIKEFLGTKSGWVSVKSDNPFVNCWYFEFNDTGIMGGDHSF